MFMNCEWKKIKLDLVYCSVYWRLMGWANETKFFLQYFCTSQKLLTFAVVKLIRILMLFYWEVGEDFGFIFRYFCARWKERKNSIPGGVYSRFKECLRVARFFMEVTDMKWTADVAPTESCEAKSRKGVREGDLKRKDGSRENREPNNKGEGKKAPGNTRRDRCLVARAGYTRARSPASIANETPTGGAAAISNRDVVIMAIESLSAASRMNAHHRLVSSSTNQPTNLCTAITPGVLKPIFV